MVGVVKDNTDRDSWLESKGVSDLEESQCVEMNFLQ